MPLSCDAYIVAVAARWPRQESPWHCMQLFGRVIHGGCAAQCRPCRGAISISRWLLFKTVQQLSESSHSRIVSDAARRAAQASIPTGADSKPLCGSSYSWMVRVQRNVQIPDPGAPPPLSQEQDLQPSDLLAGLWSCSIEKVQCLRSARQSDSIGPCQTTLHVDASFLWCMSCFQHGHGSGWSA